MQCDKKESSAHHQAVLNEVSKFFFWFLSEPCSFHPLIGLCHNWPHSPAPDQNSSEIKPSQSKAGVMDLWYMPVSAGNICDVIEGL